MRQISNRPIRKIQAVWLSSGISAATVAVLIKWLWPLLFPMFPIGTTEATVIAGFVVTIVGGFFGYYTAPSPLDVPIDKTQAES